MMAKADDAESNGQILVGTASWSDPGFVERWYPKGLPAGDRLAWYADHFEMVEVNATFYSVPDPRMVERWIRSTPDEFTFDVKLHQLLSRHSTTAKFLPPALQKRLETDGKGRVKLTPEIESVVLKEFLRAVSMLRDSGKLGALLLQLSPSFSPRKHQLDELRPLLGQMSDYEVAVEFRNRNWAEGERLQQMLDFLREHGAAYVAVDAPAIDHFMVMPHDLDATTTGELAYLRLHGRDANAYTTGKTVATRFDYDYNDEEIGEIAERAKKLARQAKKVHVVFNNNNLDYAPHAALRTRAALGQIAKAPARQPELFAK